MNLLRKSLFASVRRPRPHLRRSGVLAAAAMVLLGLGLATPASAAVRTGHDHDNGGSLYQPPTRYHDRYEFDPGCTNLTIDVQGKDWGVETIYNVPGSNGQAFLDKNQYNWAERWVNTDTGKWFTASGHGLFREVSARFVAKKDVPADLIPPQGLIGPVYLFASVDIGSQLVVRDSDGTVISRDAGVIVAKNLFDTAGDSKPGGTSLDYQIVKVIGPHPGMDLDLCDVAAQLTS